MMDVLAPLPTGTGLGNLGARVTSLLPGFAPQRAQVNALSGASSSISATQITLQLVKKAKGRCGAGMQASKQGLFVSAVAPGSICEEAGMMVGDMLVSIDGVTAEELGRSKHKANGMLFDAKSTCTVVVIRQGADSTSASNAVLSDNQKAAAEVKAADAKAPAGVKTAAEAKAEALAAAEVRVAQARAEAKAAAQAKARAEAEAAVHAKAAAEAKAVAEAAKAAAQAAIAGPSTPAEEGLPSSVEPEAEPTEAEARRIAMKAKIADKYEQAKAAKEALDAKVAAREAAEEAAWQRLQQQQQEADEEVSFSPGDAVIFDNPRNGVLELATVLAIRVGVSPVTYMVQTANGQEREAEAKQLTMSATDGPSKKSVPALPPPPAVDAPTSGPHMYGYSKPGPRLGHGHHNHGDSSSCHGPNKVLVPGLMLTARGIGVPRNAKKGYRAGQGGRKMNFGF